jgi:hypothetical protein
MTAAFRRVHIWEAHRLAPWRLLSQVIVAGLVVAAGQPAFAGGPPCIQGPITVTGIARNPGVVQEEPNASPQANLVLEKPSCVDSDILVSGRAPLFCNEGGMAIVHGRYLPPTELIRVPVIDEAKVECSPAGAVVPSQR